jgi:ABC-type sugar transport system permease subunit
MAIKLKNIPYERKKKIYGLIFVMPWIIGFVLFFLGPMIQSITYSFQKVDMTPNGFKGTFIGFENFRYGLFNDPTFIRECVNSVSSLIQVPLILVYSLFVAVLLKDNFRGRGLMRAIAFLPVIIASGVLMQIMKEDVFSHGVREGSSVYLFSGGGLQGILSGLGLGQGVINFTNQIISKTFDITWRSGVQIMLFLAGLHTIPDYLYEASGLEGARAWEQFWKVTLPMLTPMILLNIIYSVIDTFTDYGNTIIRLLYETAFEQVKFGYSSALSLMYFVLVSAILGIVYLFIKRNIVYLED